MLISTPAFILLLRLVISAHVDIQIASKPSIRLMIEVLHPSIYIYAYNITRIPMILVYDVNTRLCRSSIVNSISSRERLHSSARLSEARESLAGAVRRFDVRSQVQEQAHMTSGFRFRVSGCLCCRLKVGLNVELNSLALDEGYHDSIR